MTDQTKPIYDQPDHPHYGPVRRLHIMLLQLLGDELEHKQNRINHTLGDLTWDRLLSSHLLAGYTERQATRLVLGLLI